MPIDDPGRDAAAGPSSDPGPDSGPGPARDADPAGDGPRAAPPLSIIALDDDEDFRQYVAAALEADGHAVRTAATPDEFFAFAAAALPDAVLLDMKMGRHSGDRVLAEIRRRWPRLCVIVVTGYPSLDSMRQTFRQDVFDYLAKPFAAEDLRRVLAQAAEALSLGRRPEDRLRAELGRRIRLARAEKGWTLRDLSDAAGLSVSQISSIERGTHLPSMESLLAIARALEQRASRWLEDAGF